MTKDGIDPDQLAQVIGEFCDAVLDPELWQVALEHACDFVGGVAANLFWQDVVDQQAAVLQSWGDDSKFVALYYEKYIGLNPLFPAAAFVEPGVVFSGDDVVSRAEFLESHFYREWVRPQGLIDVAGANLERYSTSAAAFTIRRGERQGIVDAETRRRMELLVPHVRRAVAIGREIDRHKAKSANLEKMLDGVSAGVFLLDADARLSFVNDAGREMLERRDVLVERQGVLAVLDPRADAILREALTVVGAPDASLNAQNASIALTGGAAPWLAHILPLASGARLNASLGYCAVAAVFIRKAELSVASGIESIAKVYRLTASEMRILQAGVSGGGVSEIAEALGLSLGTVKTHLGSLFAKTGTKRRADLVKTVAAHGNPLG
jgi:DNA-binding CsgD family transcriptional regulator/PAS domain-containing protein